MNEIEIVQSTTFRRWAGSLRDRRAIARISARLRSLSLGNYGDSNYIGDSIFEMRIHYGPGYRLYYLREGATLVVLLCGGDKGSQRRDIERAKRLALDWR